MKEQQHVQSSHLLVMLWKNNMKQPRRLYPGASWHDLSCFGLNFDQYLTPTQDQKALSCNNDTHKRSRSGRDGLNLQDVDSKLKSQQSGLQDSFAKQEILAPNQKSEKHTDEEMGMQKPNLNCSTCILSAKAASRGMKFMESKVDSSCQEKSMEMEHVGLTLEHLVSQLDILTQMVSLFGERLSHTEDKVLQLQKLVSPQSSFGVWADRILS